MGLHKARPFIRWPGGKYYLSRKIIALFPPDYSRYYEPFLGGGSLFFNIADKLATAYLNDVNNDLITTYREVRDNIDGVIRELKKHEKNHGHNYYYRIREIHKIKSPPKIAARFIYLNKTCFNGLYRVNSRGQFNTAIGLQKKLNICDQNTLKQASRSLQKSILDSRSFEEITPPPGDSFIYCDPPYHQHFNQYTPPGFNEDQQILLRNLVWKWTQNKAKVMVSNSNTAFIRKIYHGFNIHEIPTKYRISGIKIKISTQTELAITNY